MGSRMRVLAQLREWRASTTWAWKPSKTTSPKRGYVVQEGVQSAIHGLKAQRLHSRAKQADADSVVQKQITWSLSIRSSFDSVSATGAPPHTPPWMTPGWSISLSQPSLERRPFHETLNARVFIFLSHRIAPNACSKNNFDSPRSIHYSRMKQKVTP